MQHNFALTGLAGYVAPRHLKAIADTGHRLVAACDPHDSVGIVDSYFPDAAFFTEFERFDRHLELLRRAGSDRVGYVSVCAPNHLHDAHVRLALRIGANAICEKPLVLRPWNLDQLEDLERESEGVVNTVLQLRVHPSLIALRQRLLTSQKRHKVVLTYVTSRGTWYQYSWKGDESRSGGMATNIGIHFFDLLLWLFGDLDDHEVHVSGPTRMSGAMRLQRADVQWFLSLDQRDLPEGAGRTHREISVDGDPVEFSSGFADLHTRVYQRVLEGHGFRIADARPSIELVHAISRSKVRRHALDPHPLGI